MSAGRLGQFNGEEMFGHNMSATNLEKRALSLLNIFEKAGKTVSRVTIDGRRIELELAKGESQDEFDRIDMRHDKT